MTVEIEYERDGSIVTLQRDDWHSDKDGFVMAYDIEDGKNGVNDRLFIPKERVVTIRD